MLHLSASLFRYGWSASKAVEVFRILRPSVIVVDNAHILGEETTRKMIDLLEWAPKMIGAKSLLIITTNDIKALGKELTRPGRIDEIYSFPAPNKDERREVLVGYCREYRLELTPEQLGELVDGTEGLTHAYLENLVKVGALSAKELTGDALWKDITERLSKVLKYMNVSKDEDNNIAPPKNKGPL